MSPKSARGGGHLATFGTIARLKGNLAARQVPFFRGSRRFGPILVQRFFVSGKRKIATLRGKRLSLTAA